MADTVWGVSRELACTIFLAHAINRLIALIRNARDDPERLAILRCPIALHLVQSVGVRAPAWNSPSAFSLSITLYLVSFYVGS